MKKKKEKWKRIWPQVQCQIMQKDIHCRQRLIHSLKLKSGSKCPQGRKKKKNISEKKARVPFARHALHKGQPSLFKWKKRKNKEEEYSNTYKVVFVCGVRWRREMKDIGKKGEWAKANVGKQKQNPVVRSSHLIGCNPFSPFTFVPFGLPNDSFLKHFSELFRLFEQKKFSSGTMCTQFKRCQTSKLFVFFTHQFHAVGFKDIAAWRASSSMSIRGTGHTY